MNTIEAKLDRSDYEIYCEFLNFRIDNYWLDEKLDELYPGNMYKGLIPTLVHWLNRQDEKEVIWKRILPKENEITVCPILMCPDDCDFSCTLIVAEICNFHSNVRWNRIGIDKTNEWEAEKVGTIVQWFENFGTLNFEKKNYIEMLETFKQWNEQDLKNMSSEAK